VPAAANPVAALGLLTIRATRGNSRWRADRWRADRYAPQRLACVRTRRARAGRRQLAFVVLRICVCFRLVQIFNCRLWV